MATIDPALLLAWNSPAEKAQYQQYVENLKGSTAEGMSTSAFKDAMKYKYGTNFYLDDPTIYNQDTTGDSARNWLWNAVDRYDATPSYLRGTNAIDIVPYTPNYGGRYHVYGPDVGLIDLVPPTADYNIADFPYVPAKNLQHELMHARTYEQDIPWEQQKAFIESGWPGATQGSESIRGVMMNNPHAEKANDFSSSPYGRTSPSEDLADYLGIMSYTQNPENQPKEADLNMANDWFQEDNPQRYQMALDMLKRLEQSKGGEQYASP